MLFERHPLALSSQPSLVQEPRQRGVWDVPYTTNHPLKVPPIITNRRTYDAFNYTAPQRTLFVAEVCFVSRASASCFARFRS